ncbi:unnamed protein product [Thelazia callipaeda]|uniref:SHR-BD domain-containing protein n=1 Tax=Thelazia callipaeda TaxID=103827 RepID=A0A0N5DBK7_THECL|nr:unnamed protein product [Thelazia callipaeda]
MLSEACDIEVRLRSETKKPFQFLISVEAAKYHSKRITFNALTGKNQNQTNNYIFHIQGSQCHKKNWHFIVWKQIEDSSSSKAVWEISDHVKVKLESLPFESLPSPFNYQPSVNVSVKDDLKLHFGSRFGIISCQFCV